MAVRKNTTDTPVPVTAPETPEAATETPKASPKTPETQDTKPKRESVPEVSFAPVEFEGDFAPRTSGSRTGGGRKRSQYMIELDKYLTERYKSGKVGALECDADEKTVAALEKKIIMSSEYVKLGVRFGGYVKSPNDGKVYVTFKVVERIKRARKNKNEGV